MKTLHITSIILLLLFSFSCNAQNSADVKQKISKAEAYLKQNPQDQKNRQQLYILINDNYTKLTAEERTGIRKVLEQYGIWSTGTTYTTNEPGTR